MRDYFELDGISSETVGLWVDTPVMPAMSEQRYVEYSVEAKAESDSYAEEYRKNIPVEITAYTFERDFDPRYVYAWINGKKTVRESLRSDVYYRIKKILGIIPNYQGNGKTQLKIGFECSPYKYVYDNPEIVLINGQMLDCIGSKYAQPIIKLKISGDGVLTVNGQPFRIYDMPEDTQLTIDSEKFLVTDQNGNILLKQTEGDLPFLAVTSGEESNVISWTKSISDVRIIKNERWI